MLAAHSAPSAKRQAHGDVHRHREADRLCPLQGAGVPWRSRQRTSCPARRSAAAGEATCNGWRPSSYVEIKRTRTAAPR
jgi:hypothetical protein